MFNPKPLLLCCLLLLNACINQASQTNQLLAKTSDKPIIEVIEDAEFAITEYNFRIINRLQIGQAIKERGNLDFPQTEIILFCNLTLAEQMLQIAPNYISYCPYSVSIMAADKQTIISARLLPTDAKQDKLNQLAKKINKMLSSIVEYAAAQEPFIL